MNRVAYTFVIILTPFLARGFTWLGWTIAPLALHAGSIRFDLRSVLWFRIQAVQHLLAEVLADEQCIGIPELAIGRAVEAE